MKIDFRGLPKTHYPGQSFMTFDKDDVYIKIAIHDKGLFNFLTRLGYSDVRDALNVHPEINYDLTLDGLNKEFVITLSSGTMMEPQILYRWNQDHWERVEDVRTDIS
jgi:hypothetical protein